MNVKAQDQKRKVRETYGEIARTRDGNTAATCCAPTDCKPDYSSEEIASVPKGAFLGEGSGNPVRAARLKTGETVIDLGAGAGMDVFLAANQVGASGRVVGIDMTPEMLKRARANAARGDYPQVEFHQADIERLPLPSNSADVVLSNCVINLAPDKSAVYREIFRVLKPGGRFAIADIVRDGEPGLIRKVVEKLDPCGCVATALERNAYLEVIRTAGFEDVETVAERPAVSQPLDKLVRAQAVTLVGQKPDAG
jgi:SAM-dependent methyltransferase